MILADMNPPCLPELGENLLFETDRPRLIEAIKTERARVLAKLGDSLAAGEDTGWTAAARLAHWTDVLITDLFEQIQTAKPESRRTPWRWSGWGVTDAELAPHSDIDLLFLTQNAISDDAAGAVEALLYVLWDAGFKVGHAVRSMNQCMSEANEDVRTLTSMIESLDYR